MNRFTQTLALFALVACAKTEDGIDTTTIRGNIVIPPSSFEEPADSGETANDSWDMPTELPMLTYRRTSINGTAQDFGDMESSLVGNGDHYTLAAVADGELSVILDFETSQGMGRDKTILELYLYDLDNAEEECATAYSCAAADCACEATYAEGTSECVEADDCEETCTWEVVETETCVPIATTGGGTDGTLGYVEFTMPVVSGGNYGVLVISTDSTEYDPGSSMPYTLELGALEPVDDSFLVGAYLSDDVQVRGDPVGGASVYDMEWDELNGMWMGKFEIVHIKSVVTEDINCVVETRCSCDCGCSVTYEEETGQCMLADDCEEECVCETEEEEVCEEEHTVTEGHPTVWLMGGTWPTLNASIPSGALFSSQAVQVATGDGSSQVGDWGLDTAEDTQETTPETDTADTAGPEPVAAPTGEIVVSIDTIQPRVIGWEFVEVEPNDVVPDQEMNYILHVEDLVNANVLPEPSGPGITDIIYGDLPCDTEEPLWADGYVDVFAITMTEDLNATFTLGWDDCSADVDLHLYNELGELMDYSWNGCPESIDTAVSDNPLLEGSTWYLAVLPWQGPVATFTYSLEIEYAPL